MYLIKYVTTLSKSTSTFLTMNSSSNIYEKFVYQSFNFMTFHEILVITMNNNKELVRLHYTYNTLIGKCYK